MAVVCPAGHVSLATDYCDTCGALIGGSASAAPSTAGGTDPCPGCGAAQGGRFCEECGYDFELAALVPAGAVESAASTGTGSTGAGSTGVAGSTGSGAAAEPDFDLDAALEAAESAAAAGGVSPDEEEAEAESTVIVLGTGAQLDLIAVVNADLSYYQAQVARGDIVESEFPFPKFPGERRIALDVGQVRIGRASASRGLAVEIDLTGPPLDPAISHLHAQLLRQPDHSWTLVDLNSANGTRLNDAEDPIPAEIEVPVAIGDRIHLGVWTTITLIEP